MENTYFFRYETNRRGLIEVKAPTRKLALQQLNDIHTAFNKLNGVNQLCTHKFIYVGKNIQSFKEVAYKLYLQTKREKGVLSNHWTQQIIFTSKLNTLETLEEYNKSMVEARLKLEYQF